jgi:hypothetical protein
MRKKVASIFIAALVLVSTFNPAWADVAIRVRLKEGPHPASEMLIRIKGTRQRNDFQAENRSDFSWVYYCDRKKVIGINYTTRRYFINSLGSGMTLSQSMAFGESQFVSAPRSVAHHDGRLVQTVTVTDTGERREMFGFTARHIKTRTTWEAEPACNQTRLRQETDGWYIDLLHGMECSPDLSGYWNYGFVAPPSKCSERFEKRNYEFLSKQVGDARLGFPLRLTRTVYGDGGQALVNSEEVLDLSTAELDASLFDIPSTFTKFDPGSDRSLLGRLFSFAGRRRK